MRVPPKQSSVRFGSYPSGLPEQSGRSKPRGQQPASGGLASSRAITRVNPGQASKEKLLTPTRLDNGEGRSASGEATDRGTPRGRRGNGNGTWARFLSQRGRSDAGVGSRPATSSLMAVRSMTRCTERTFSPTPGVLARHNGGAPGVDGVTFEAIETQGLDEVAPG